MTDVNETQEKETPSEIEVLKQQADVLGIDYHPAIGVVKLQEKIDAHLCHVYSDKADVENKKKDPTPATKSAKLKTKTQLMQEHHTRLRNDARRLVRVIVTCMNPNKRDWQGEIFTVSNSVVGTIKKYVPFNVTAGYHVPHMIYEQLLARRYQHFVKKRLPTGRTQMIPTISKEFNVQLLSPLTAQELEDLKVRQALNHSIDK